MPAERKSVVVVGSINMDLVARAERIPLAGETVAGSSFQTHHGGKGANQAVAVARLGYPVKMIGRVGSDAFGEELRQNLHASGVDVAGVATSAGASGVAVIVVSDAGENCIVVTPGANALVTPQDIDDNLETLRGAGMVLAQLEIPLAAVEHLATVCERAGVPLMLDPAPARALPEELFRKVAWFTPNETEAAFFLGEDGTAMGPEQMADTLLGKGIRGVVLKRGGRGAYLKSGSEAGALVAPFTVKAVDTTAAGDAFNGAFAASLMTGKGAAESARFAAAAAAVSVTRAGAQGSMASMEEVQAMLRRG
jgi:ribokinase